MVIWKHDFSHIYTRVLLSLSIRTVLRVKQTILRVRLIHSQTLARIQTHTYTQHTNTYIQRFRAFTSSLCAFITHTHPQVHDVFAIRARMHTGTPKSTHTFTSIRKSSILATGNYSRFWYNIIRTQSLFVSPFPEYFCLHTEDDDVRRNTRHILIQFIAAERAVHCVWH